MQDQIDMNKLTTLLGTMVSDVGAAANAALVLTGAKLGLYRALGQEVGAALGAQAGERRLSEIILGAGFSKVRRAAETPFNMILEARP